MEINDFIKMANRVIIDTDAKYIEFSSSEIDFCGEKEGFAREVYATYFIDDEEVEIYGKGGSITVKSLDEIE